MIKNIVINGAAFRVKAASISNEPIWSKDTGRGADGTMLGDLIGYKIKMELEFPPMWDAEAKRLGTALRAKAYFDVEFHNPFTDKDEKKKFYAGATNIPVYSYHDDLITYQSPKVDLIEV